MAGIFDELMNFVYGAGSALNASMDQGMAGGDAMMGRVPMPERAPPPLGFTRAPDGAVVHAPGGPMLSPTPPPLPSMQFAGEPMAPAMREEIMPPVVQMRPAMPQFATTTESLPPPAAVPASMPQPIAAAGLPSMPAAAPASDGTDIIDSLRGFSAGYRNGGLLGGFTEALGGVQKDRRETNMTADALQRYGLDPDIATRVARDPALLRPILAGLFKKSKAGQEGVKYGVNPVFGVNDKGETVPLAMGDDGTAKTIDAPGVTFSKPKLVNRGNSIDLVDGPSGRVIESYPVNNQQAEYDKQRGEGLGKIDNEKPAKFAKASSARNSLNRKGQMVLEDMERAITRATTGLPTTGIWSISKDVPGTPAHELAKILDSVQANIGFDELQQMREASPTGGALGSITEKEIAFLQALRGSMAQSQKAEDLVFVLKRAKADYAQLMKDRETAFSRDFGDMTGNQPGAAPGGAMPDAGGFKVLRVR